MSVHDYPPEDVSEILSRLDGLAIAKVYHDVTTTMHSAERYEELVARDVDPQADEPYWVDEFDLATEADEWGRR